MLRALCLAIAVLMGLSASLMADKRPASSLDEELLESLDSELLEGLETVPVDEGDDAGAAADVASGEEDAFTRISRQMREVERMLVRTEAAGRTSKAQRQIVSEMEKLIDELEQQCQKCKGGVSSGSKSQQTAKREKVEQPSSQKASDGEHDANNPAQDATERLGKDEVRKADMDQMQGLLKDIWGQLPEKARDQMLQSSPEQFLPKYELLIEDYYKRLAERQSK